jgi:hypothetical protein
MDSREMNAFRHETSSLAISSFAMPSLFVGSFFSDFIVLITLAASLGVSVG